MSATLHSFLSVGNVDELSPVMAEPHEPVELQVAAMTASAIDRLWARASHDNDPEQRLSDRDWDVCTEKLQDKIDADFVSDVVDPSISDTELGGKIRMWWGEIVLNRLGR